MGSLSKLIKEKGGDFGEPKTRQIKVQQIHHTKLKESALNFYTRSDNEVEELADTMLIAGGILQPLIVRKTDMSEYEILAGHKRKRASVYNVDRGYKEFEFLPCIVIDMSGLMAKKISERILAEQGDVEDDRILDMITEYIVICTNSTASESSHYEKMMQAVRLSKILPAMLENEELKGRALRAEIAREMKCGDGQVGRYQSIYNNLVPGAMELFKNGQIGLSVASRLAGLDKGQQEEAIKKQQISLADIEVLKQGRDTSPVSNLDTGEVHGVEPLDQENSNRTVSNLDTNNMDLNPAGDLSDKGDEKAEGTEEDIRRIFRLIFDDEGSGFPGDVKKELLDFMAEMGGHVSVMTDILDKALPFENSRIRIERIYGYTVCFKDEHKKIGVALWPFWREFKCRYYYHEGPTGSEEPEYGHADDDRTESCPVPDKGDVETAASMETEPERAYNVGYTLEDVQEIYGEQEKIIKELERERKYDGLTAAEERLYKTARIVRDGLSYILEAFKEGTIC